MKAADALRQWAVEQRMRMLEKGQRESEPGINLLSDYDAARKELPR